jgi:AcrR family transcriptional regulator
MEGRNECYHVQETLSGRTSMPKIVDYDQRKREIVSKALEVFTREGYWSSNLSQIADLCGLGRTTIYKYFRNKDEIFYFAMDSMFGRIEATCSEIAARPSVQVIEKIRLIISETMEASLEEKNSMVLVIELWIRLRREENEIAVQIRERAFGMKRIFENLLRVGIESGEIRPVNVDAMAFTLFSLVESFIIHASFFGNFSFDESMESLSILLDGLRVGRV